LDLAADEAALRGVPLHIYHADSPEELWPTVGQRMPVPVQSARILADAADRASRRHPALVVETHVVAGRPTAVLIEASTQAELTVVGHRGGGGFHGLAAGFVCTQVTTRGRGPVFVARGTAVDMRAPVVIGVDARLPVPAAIEFAFAEAALRGVPLHAIYAWGYLPDEDHDEARGLLSEALADSREAYPDVKVEVIVEHSLDPPAAMLAASGIASLVVIGPHDQTAPRRLLLGSVAEILTHHSRCPVAVVHPYPALVGGTRSPAAAVARG
jgi:nucleotide-binding universal stress UspA family protein